MTASKAQQKFDRMVAAFKTKYQTQAMNVSGSDWTGVEELLRRLTAEMKNADSHKIKQKKIKKDNESKLRNSEIGLQLLDGESSDSSVEKKSKKTSRNNISFSTPSSLPAQL